MENKTIEALEKLIALKDETIKELERQVQLLKSQPPVSIPSQPFTPSVPYPYIPQQPAYPWQPISPGWPYGTWITISDTTVPINPCAGSSNTLTLVK